MQKTKIEWCDYSWNPVKGLCPQNCKLPDGTPYCYARRMYQRYKWNPKVRLHEPTLYEQSPLQSQRIFVGSTIDLFHPKIPKDWIKKIITVIGNNYFHQKHTFIFLTKFPARYAEFDFPDNCWLGVTVTKQEDATKRLGPLLDQGLNRVLFASAEPLLGSIDETTFAGLDWVIVGALTGPQAKKYQPQRKWVADIVSLKQMVEVSIFLKNNLKEVWREKLIREYPQ